MQEKFYRIIKKRGHDTKILAKKLNTINGAWHYLLSKKNWKKNQHNKISS